MNAKEMAELRKANKWTQADLAGILNEALGRSYDANYIGRIERGDRAVPGAVGTFLESLIEQAIEGETEELILNDAILNQARKREARKNDSAPEPDGPAVLSALSSPSTTYAAMCEQFFEMIATGVGMIGAATGNTALRADGEVILRDKQALGKAYGKLAETNEAFRNLLTQTDKQGAYLAVALATGTTAGAIWRNHSVPSQPIVSAEEVLGAHTGDSSPAAATA